MSYDSQAQSTYGAQPFELFWFAMAPTFPPGIDPQNWYLTSGDTRTYLSNVYDSLQITKTAVQQDKEMQSGGIDMELPSDHPVALQFLRGRPVAQIDLTIFAGHENDTEVVVIFSGTVKTATFDGSKAKLHVAPDHQAVRKDVPCVDYQRRCAFIVYDSQCGIPIGAASPMRMSWPATIESIGGSDDKRTINIAPGEFVDYWVNNHHWTGSGDNQVEPSCALGFVVLPSGRCIMIENQQGWGKALVLQRMDDEIVAGLEITIHRGCRGTLSDCKQINSQVNFMGFEAIPANPFLGLY